MTVVKAKYKGRCRYCGKAIKPGSMVTPHRTDKTWVHLTCITKGSGK